MRTGQKRACGLSCTGDVAYLLSDIFHDADGKQLSDMTGCVGVDDDRSICVFLTDAFSQSTHIGYDCWILLAPSGIVTMFYIMNKSGTESFTRLDEIHL